MSVVGFYLVIVFICFALFLWQPRFHFRLLRRILAVLSSAVFTIICWLLLNAAFFSNAPASMVKNYQRISKEDPFAASDSEYFCLRRNYNTGKQELAIYALPTLAIKDSFTLGSVNSYARIEHIAWSGKVLAFIMNYYPDEGMDHHSMNDLVFYKDHKLIRIPHATLKDELCASVYWDGEQNKFIDCSFSYSGNEHPCWVKRTLYDLDPLTKAGTDSFQYSSRNGSHVLISMFKNAEFLFGYCLGRNYKRTSTRISTVPGVLTYSDSIYGKPITPMTDQGSVVELQVSHERDSTAGFFPAKGSEPGGLPFPVFKDDSVNKLYSDGYNFLRPDGYLEPRVLYRGNKTDSSKMRIGDHTISLTHEYMDLRNEKNEVIDSSRINDFSPSTVFKLPGQYLIADFYGEHYVLFDDVHFKRLDKVPVMERLDRVIFNGREHPAWFKTCFFGSLFIFLPILLFVRLKRKNEDPWEITITAQRLWIFYLALAIPALVELVNIL